MKGGPALGDDLARIDRKERHAGIDAARYLLCFAVVLLHSLPRPDGGSPGLAQLLIAIFCRGAVPFFFITSGYLAHPKVGRPSARPLVRLLPVYVFWMLVYGLLSGPGGIGHPNLHQLVTGGTAFHLWFIPALAVSLTLVPWLVANAGLGLALAVCGLCSLAALAFDAYHQFLPIPALGGTRALAAPGLVLIGIMLARLDVAPKVHLAIPAVLIAWGLCWAEETAIAALAHRPAMSHAMVASTYLLGTALFLSALSASAGSLVRMVARLGRISLGVYASHLLFVMWLAARWGKMPLYHSFTIAILSMIAATLLSWGASKVRGLDRVVQ